MLFCRLRADLVRVCRVPPGCCRDPHPASVTHSPGSPGVRRFAKRFKFAVPRRGTGRVEPKTSAALLEGLPFLSFPPAVRGSPYPTAENRKSLFFRFFSIFFASKKTIVKNYFFRTFLRFRLAPASIFSRFGSQNGSPGTTFSVFFRKRRFCQNRAPA